MSEHPISNLMTETMAKIKEMVDVNTIIGTPITTADGTTVIPVSKVTFGFASGGSDFAPKHMPQGAPRLTRFPALWRATKERQGQIWTERPKLTNNAAFPAKPTHTNAE